MPWVRIDEQFAQHPKVRAVGPLGMAMHVAALCYANQYLTDGFIHDSVVPGLVNLDDLGGWGTVVDDLVRAGLWTEKGDGWQIHDFLDYQPSRTKVLEERDRNRVAGSKGGKARAKRTAKRSASGPLSDRLADSPALGQHPAAAAPSDGPVSATTAPTPLTAPGEQPQVRASPKRTAKHIASEPLSEVLTDRQAEAQAKSKPVPGPVPQGDPRVTGVPPAQGEVVVTVAGSKNQNRPVGIHPAMRRQVFDAWLVSLPPGTSRRLTPARDKAIQARLREFPLADCLDAARGWTCDPWPDRGQHNDIATLFRPGNFERMRDFARDGPPRVLSKEQRQMYQNDAEMAEWSAAMKEAGRDNGRVASPGRTYQRELPPPAAQT